MSKYRQYSFIILILITLSVAVLGYCLWDNKVVPEQYNSIGRAAGISPDYSGTVIPPNIAPLNFLIQEPGSRYYIKIYSRNGEPIEIFSRSPKIMIPPKPWHKLLDKNKGRQLYFDIFVETADGQWNRFDSVTNRIANEKIDSLLAYRKMRPLHGKQREHERIGVYQYDLENHNESVILDNGYYYNYGCVNCHTFYNNRPDKMLISIRNSKHGGGVLLLIDGKVNKIGTKFGCVSWHPSGRMLVYSLNKVRQFFHSAQTEVRDTVDLDSTLAYYVLGSEAIKTAPVLSDKEYLETYPCWSVDGRYLYFCRAPKLWQDQQQGYIKHYSNVKYDLVRVSYDIDRDQWGPLETVISAKDTGLSTLFPKISPDGRWLLVCMCNYGSLPMFQPSSDLYMIDLEAARRTGKYEYRWAEANSDQSESWHSWSSNSRWIAFSSKRRDGVFTRLHISYVDQNGKTYKPIVMPQKDPTFYDSLLQTLNTPEFIIEPVKITGEKLGRVARSSRQLPVDMPITMATPQAGTIFDYTSPQEERQ